MRSPNGMPAAARKILELLLPDIDAGFLIGDFEELYVDLVERRGRVSALLWLAAQILKSIPGFILNTAYWSALMLKNYLKVTVRNIRRAKGYSAITLFGLAAGIACVVVIGLFVFEELTFDRYHEKAERIYRVCSQYLPASDGIGAYTAPPMASALKADFPEIESIARLSPWYRKRTVETGENIFLEEWILFADSSLFSVFTIPFVSGDPRTALAEPNTVVLTESIAEKYFGDADPTGGTLKIDGREQLYRITGVIRDCPAKSHVRYDMVVSLSTSSFSRSDRWMSHTYFTYLVLPESYPPEQLERKFPDFIRRHYGPIFLEETGARYENHYDGTENYYGYRLQPLTEIHLNPRYSESMPGQGDSLYVYVLSTVAFFILLLACINFMNLSTARFAYRSKEVGVRKALGSTRRQLVVQFLFESVLFSILSLALAVLLAEAALPRLRAAIGRELAFPLFSEPGLLFLLLGFALLTGILAGLYPAFFLASFKPARTLKGVHREGSGAMLSLRKGLVVLQFAVSVAICFGTFVVYSQLDYVRSRNMGYEREGIIVVDRPNTLGERQHEFREELLRSPLIDCASYTVSLPGRHFDPNGHVLEGRPKTDEQVIHTMYADEHLDDLLGLTVTEGRFFDGRASDSLAVVINESTARALGLSDPVGKRFHKTFGEYKDGDFVTIVGVIKDIHFKSLHSPVQPMIFRNMAGEIPDVFSVRCSREHMAGAARLIEEKWAAFTGGIPLDYTFFDDDLNRLYDTEEKLGGIVGVFAALALVIACLGLIGLVAFAAQRRTREIGIRKTLGSSGFGIVRLLSRDFLLQVLAGSLIAWPAAYYAMDRWLHNFAYRIEPGIAQLALITAAVLAAAMCSIALHALRAARANPVDSLRCE